MPKKSSKSKSKSKKAIKAPIKHILVPEYKKLSEEEVKKLMEELMIDSLDYLPKIFTTDPAIQHLKPKPGDVIKIIRKSPTAGESIYYRVVIPPIKERTPKKKEESEEE